MRRMILACVSLLAAVGLPGVALGVWGGNVDVAHPQVGAMYFDYAGEGLARVDGMICSGSYAGESKDGRHDVFLTAGHCLPPAEEGIDPGDLYVSFDSNAAVADLHDPVSGAIRVDDYRQMPGFGHDRGDPHDLGLLLLPKDSVPASIAPVRLPREGYLDALKAEGTLKFMVADIVGYGVTPIWEPAGPTGFAWDARRRAGTSVVTGLLKAQVIFNQNPNGIGTGSGLCFGDSGSPQLQHGSLLVLSVTSGGNGQCNSYNVDYRVDTAVARAFLGEFLVLP